MEFVGAAVQGILKADSDVVGLTQHIYHARIPQSEVGFLLGLRHYVDDVIPSPTKDDDGGIDGDGASQIDTYEYRIEIFGQDDFLVVKLARAVRSALDRKAHGYYEHVTSSGAFGVNLQGIEFVGAGEMPDLEDTPDYYFVYMVFSIRVLRTT